MSVQQETASGTTVLIIDDNPADLLLVSSNLKSLNYEVHTISDPECALQKARCLRPDVILLDVQMPGINGFDLCLALKSDPDLCEIPVLFLTGIDEVEAKVRGFEAGGADYLVKPIQPAELRARVATQVKLRRTSLELAEGNRRLRQKIGEFEKVQAALMESESRIQSVLNNAAVCIGMADIQGNYELVNNRCADLFGYERDEMVGMSCRDLIEPVSRDQINTAMEEIVKGSQEQSFQVNTFRRADGSLFPGGCYLSARLDTEKNCTGFVCVITDLSEQVKSERELQLAHMVFNTCSEGLMVTDGNNRIVMVNPTFTQITGYTAAEVLGKNPNILKSGRHDRQFYKTMWEHLLQRQHWSGEIWNRRKNGEIYPQWASISVIRDENDRIINYLAMFTDITERKKAEAVLRRQALHDQLTGLPNRTLFNDNLKTALARAKRLGNMVALLYIDVDNFKDINDRLGHMAGDRALQKVADCLRGCLREHDVVARLGGDEFAAILCDISGIDQAVGSAERILKQTVQIRDSYGALRKISFSIGIAVYPEHAKSRDILLRRADDAMYVAKRQGKGRYYVAGRESC